jgi:hypothetical protein
MCAYEKVTKVVKRKRHALKEELRQELLSQGFDEGED